MDAKSILLILTVSAIVMMQVISRETSFWRNGSRRRRIPTTRRVSASTRRVPSMEKTPSTQLTKQPSTVTPDPIVCYNNVTVMEAGVKKGFFVCPDADSADRFAYCCGEAQGNYCCPDFFYQGGNDEYVVIINTNSSTTNGKGTVVLLTVLLSLCVGLW